MMLCVRPRLGQSESRGSDLHRVLGDPQEPGHPSVKSSLPGPGRVAAGAHQSDDSHWQRARQQCVGGQHARTTQTHAGCQQVGDAVPQATDRGQRPPLSSADVSGIDKAAFKPMFLSLSDHRG